MTKRITLIVERNGTTFEIVSRKRDTKANTEYLRRMAERLASKHRYNARLAKLHK